MSDLVKNTYLAFLFINIHIFISLFYLKKMTRKESISLIVAEIDEI